MFQLNGQFNKQISHEGGVLDLTVNNIMSTKKDNMSMLKNDVTTKCAWKYESQLLKKFEISI